MTRKQCSKCPWRKDVDPHDIPDGYCTTKHRGLKNTIANPGDLRGVNTLRIMACHESNPGEEIPCVGWMMNQLGPGNNIGLRFAVMTKRVDADVETVGEQHERFEDTVPD